MSNNQNKIFDTSSTQLLRGSTSVLGLNVLSKLFSTGLKSVIAHLLGASALGVYELTLALMRFFSMITQFGLHQTIVHFISVYRTKSDWNYVKKSISIGYFLVVFFTSTVCLLLFLARDFLKSIFFDPSTSEIVILLTIVLIITYSINNYSSFVLRGLKWIKSEIFLNRVLSPLLVLIAVLFTILFSITLSVELIIFYNVIATSIALIAGAFLILNVLKSTYSRSKKYSEKKKLINYSIPVWFTTVLGISINQSDRILIGVLSTNTELGFYAASYALALMVNFVLSSFNPVFQPMITEAYSTGNTVRIKNLYQEIVDISSFLVLPIMWGTILFGKEVLVILFGTEFEAAYIILVLLIFSESVNALAGPVGDILTMTERQKLSARILVIGVATGIILNLILIPPFGGIGAAFGTGVSIILINILRIIAMRRSLKIYQRFEVLIKATVVVSITASVVFILGNFIESLWVNVSFYLISVSLAYFLFFRDNLKKVYLTFKISVK